ncbi:hypothetical protein IWQ56_006361 [Coemansia nantahalensis]|nr:hypothetical protein IWQ56_006361 [Coemansia nantahalensis]
MVELDLATVKLIDPAADLVGAMRQADHIAYTLNANKLRIKGGTMALRADCRKRIKEIRSECAEAKAEAKAKAKAEAKAKAKAKAKGGKRKSKKAVAEEPAVEEPAAEEPLDETSAQSINDRVWVLEKELESAIIALHAKYPTSFSTPKITVSPAETPELFQRASDLVREGKLAGRFVKRIEWRDIKFTDLPTQGDFDIAQVRKSQYFFS